VTSMDGVFMLGVRAETHASAGIASDGGDNDKHSEARRRAAASALLGENLTRKKDGSMSQVDLDLLRAAAAYGGEWIAYQQERRDVPGVVVAVWGGDHLLLSQGYGYADLEGQEPMTPAHIFRIASHSKTFTATAVMQLVERGRLRLDDRIATFVPWLQGLADLDAVTVRQALNHTSGIVRDGHDADYWQLESGFPDQDGVRRLVEEGGRVLATNEAFKYSNIAYALLGLVIEAAAGLPYNDVVRQQIIGPLGLRDTGPETDAHARERLVTGYTQRRLGLARRPIPDVPTAALSPATGFYSTAKDLCRYAAAHFLGNQTLLSDAAKREMQQPSYTITQSDDRYGLGLSSVEIGERRLVGHGGAFPGHSTRTLFDPKEGIAVVVLTNETRGPAATLAAGLWRIIDFALRQPSGSGQRTPALEQFTGRFVNLWGVLDVVAFGDTLIALAPDDEDPGKTATRLVVLDDTTLRITTTSGYGAPGETVRYVRDATGRVEKIISGGLSSYPLDLYRQREPSG